MASRGRRGVLHLHGSDGAGQLALSRWVCRRLGPPVLLVDVPALLSVATGAASLLRTALRDGMLRGAAIHLSRADALWSASAGSVLAVFDAALADFDGWILSSGSVPWPGEAALSETPVS